MQKAINLSDLISVRDFFYRISFTFIANNVVNIPFFLVNATEEYKTKISSSFVVFCHKITPEYIKYE